jgi:HD-GYP domain-containing protein (c-di-GMP phosphodiesterase class II)
LISGIGENLSSSMSAARGITPMSLSLIEVVGSRNTNGAWRSNHRLRIGRLPNLEIVLDDNSLSRQHAEIALTDDGWTIRDLGSTNGTFLNGVRIGRTGQRLRNGDQIECGHIGFNVRSIIETEEEPILAPGQILRVESAARGFWSDAICDQPVHDSAWEHRQRSFFKLLRDVCRISSTTTMDAGLPTILKDVIAVFSSQRGGVLLKDAATDEFVVRSVVANRHSLSPVNNLSKTLANRTFQSGRSLLFRDCSEDEEMRAAESVRRGTMTSVICALLPSNDGPTGILHLDRGPLQEPFNQADLDLADALAAAVALGIERWQLAEKQQDMLIQTVTALAQAVEMRDQYTGNHTHRVTTYALLIADELRLMPSERRLLQVATPLHDIGKIAVDDSVLRKPGGLSDAELLLMKSHVASGVNIVQMIPALNFALPVIRSHHEKWDGSGYPDGLQGESIPLLARIVAVADAFDAMTTDRPYRKGLNVDAAFSELVSKAGIHFDPQCVGAFVRARPKVEAMLQHDAKLKQDADDITKTLSRRDLTRILAQTIGPGDQIPKFD